MKHIFQFFRNLFQGLAGKLFVVTNFIICLFIFDWGKFFRYLETPERINCHIKPNGRGIDLCLYSMYPSFVEPVLMFLGVLLFILVYPSIAMTEIVLELLKKLFPLWCIETYDILYIPIFAVINSFYWLFLGDMIEIAHSAYLRNKPIKKTLSIFPN